MDLSNYVLVGRYGLPEPTTTAAPAGNLLAQEASAVTYDPDTDSLFVVGDGGTAVVQVSKTGQLIDTMTLAPGNSPQGTAFYDTEGITYVGGGMFVMTEERDRNAVLFTYSAGTTLDRPDAQIAHLGTFVPNIGLEGVTYDPSTNGFVFVKETLPEGIFQTTIDFATDTASNGSASTDNSVNLFDPALTGLADFADVFALSNLPSLAGTAEADNLLILSQESGKIEEVQRDGTIVSSKVLFADPSLSISVADQQFEGMTMDHDGNLYLVAENGGGDINHPQLFVFSPANFADAAPTALSFVHAVTAIDENTSTAQHIKLADVAISDDGIGTNNLSVSGPDAAFFEVDNTGLYLKAGTVLDFETKASYAVTVNVDDPGVGSGSDASANFTLNVNDIANEGGSGSKLFISEAAPWSSGNSPVGHDWFEVTNGGSSDVDITGWKMDDSSASFASAVDLSGITTIHAGESVIFIEADSVSDIDAARASFIATWFGGHAPAGLQIGVYSGGGVSLSTGGDGVTLFNAGGNIEAKITFGASPGGPFPTFDNSAGLNDAAVDTLSQTGSHGAVEIVDSLGNHEIGSPGTTGHLFISEVAPWSSGDSPVGADWFEVTNGSGVTADLSGWKMDDNSQSPVAAVALNGVSSIAPGESVIFLETSDLNAAKAAFIDTWFGGHAPAGLQFGSYSGSGVGLGTGGDAVNLYDSHNVLQASVNFGKSTAAPGLQTFDNAAGANGVTLTTLSSAGSDGAFQVTDTLGNTETGSPGAIKSAPVVDLPPSAVELTNTLASIDENTPTPSHVKVADVSVIDDGHGTNNLALTGADAGFFEIEGTALYLKAGTTLDFETKASYAVTVTVDDPAVGASPDASTSYTLQVNDIANEGGSPPPPALRITEVAPWSSSDSPVGQDWFEVTNFSNAAADISGWRFDDDSHNFANSVALNGVTTIAAGESVIFLNTSDPDATKTAFIDTWFGGHAPAGLQFGSFSGSGTGLGTGGDEVNLYKADGTLAASVGFGASTGAPALATFDNAEGLDQAVLTHLAANGANGSFTVADSLGNSETGSPGAIKAPPTPNGFVDGVPTVPNAQGVTAAHTAGAHIYAGENGAKLSSTAGNPTFQGGAGQDTFIVQEHALAQSSGLTNGIAADAVIFGFANAGGDWVPTNNDFLALSGFGAGSTMTFAHYGRVNGADDNTVQFYTVHDTATNDDFTLFVKSLDGQQLAAGDYHFY